MDRPTIIVLCILMTLLAAELIWLEVRNARQRSKKDALPHAPVMPDEQGWDKKTEDNNHDE